MTPMRSQRAALACIILSLAGLLISAYLGFIHVALLRGELVGGVGCGAVGSIFNCHAVTSGRFGSAFGMPLALWGLLGYLAALTLSVIAWRCSQQTAPALSSLALLGLLFIVIDAALLFLMATQIHYFCPLCLITYAINVLLVAAVKFGTKQS